MKSRFVYELLWLVFVALFLATSIPPIWSGLREKSIHFVGPTHSTDLYLEMAGDFPERTERLARMLAALPKDKHLLVLINQDDPRSICLGFVTAYLAWPRDVQLTKLDSDDCRRQLQAFRPETVSAIVFCGNVSRPQWIPHGAAFGRWLEVVPIT